MGRAENDQWLDEALDNAIASHDTQPDFETWKANHPEAVQRLTARVEPPAGHPQTIRRITMNSLFVKLAAAAAITIAAGVGITQLTKDNGVTMTGVREITTLAQLKKSGAIK